MDEVILVDQFDNEIGTLEKMQAHQERLLHRAFSVFVFNSKKELLLQKRAKNKYHSAGLWTNTVCSHPKPGESVKNAAKRRLMEEMGLECDVKPLYDFIYFQPLEKNLAEFELDHVLVGYTDVVPVINSKEVDEWKYSSPIEMEKELHKNPEQFSSWFKLIYSKLKKFI